MTDMAPIKAKGARVKAPPPAQTSVEAAIEAAGRLTAEAAAMTAPIMSRAVVARNAADMRLKELDRERADLTDRQALLTAQYQSAMAGLQEHITDIDDEVALIRGGIGGQP